MENSNLQKNILFSQMFLNNPHLCIPSNPYFQSILPFQAPITIKDILQHQQNENLLRMSLLPQQLPLYTNLLKEKLSLMKTEENLMQNNVKEEFKSLQNISFSKHNSCQTEIGDSKFKTDIIKIEEKELPQMEKACSLPLNLKSVSLNNEFTDLKKKRRAGKKLWNSVEDALALELIAEHGTKWSKIGKIIGGRTGKQVRDRYLNNLRPNIKNDAWTDEEDDILINLYYKMGSKWSKIANFMPGRTESQVKNRFYTYIKMRLPPLDVEKNAMNQNINLALSSSSPNGTEAKAQEIKTEGSYSLSGEEFIVKEEDSPETLKHDIPQLNDKYQQKKKVKGNN